MKFLQHGQVCARLDTQTHTPNEPFAPEAWPKQARHRIITPSLETSKSQDAWLRNNAADFV